MKSVMKNLVRDEKGAALILALILLLIGGLISAALLGHMGAGILAGEVYEKRTAELYAADAGVEDAIWKIQHGETQVCPGDPYWSYNIADVNGKSLQISIEYVGEGTYKITSTAATDDGGNTAAIVSATTVESYVSALYMNFSALLDYAIVSNSAIDIQPNVSVNGSVWLPDKEDLSVASQSEITGDRVDFINDGISTPWPGFDQLSTYYLEDVVSACDFGDSIDIEDTKTIGPCYTDGSLKVDNTGEPDTLVLEGTLYVRGNLEFEQPGNAHYTVDLNGQTIFAEGYITFASHGVSISGSGCIIARDYIIFQPSISSNPDDFVLVMSIEDTVTLQPSGDFTGCVAGNEVVQLQPAQGEDFTVTWIDPEGQELDFPMGVGDDDELPPVNVVNIESWEIIQQ